MAKITALIHTHNDEQRIGRALESLRACDEVLVIDHGSTDNTIKVAQEHGATVKTGVPGVTPGVYAIDAHHDWIFCMLPTESIAESLEAALFAWKEREDEASSESEKDKQSSEARSYCVGIRAETGNGWRELPVETRLVNRKKINWPDHLPPTTPGAIKLEGELLRFEKP